MKALIQCLTHLFFVLIVKGGWNKTTCKLELKYMYSRVQRVVSIDDKPVQEGILEC